ncbi:transcriptional regulatory protein ompR [Asticcacaulis biprosthecium C19]|uniref:Transcriptional regulatory protein ompR n=1 Tax=Asticcacaulis biprosthecium C19 TaxID=715226 RepID=F4QU24_9CAUL|nr:response regulator [Asticcacaulis biprosthecium]EGF89324.1 transcriptional regulatory protein ompR [Asticcacaulis biprosthecium C19]
MSNALSQFEMATILVVDDTDDIRELLEISLALRGFHVLTADGGRQMDAILASRRIDLIVLDAMMPGEDGLSICKRVSSAKGPPIIMLSARGEDIDRLKGLEIGAQDYVSKPFNADELAARIRIVIGRHAVNGAPGAGTTRTHFFNWSLDTVSRIMIGPSGHQMILSQAELAVMRVFLNHPDRPLKREQILSGMADLHEHTTPRALDAVISRLRKKLNDAYPEGAKKEELIRTVYAVGYMFRPEFKR